MSPRFLVVVTGLRAEASVANPVGGRVIAAGGDAARLASELDAAIAGGAGAVLSFGLAGGLQPDLHCGTVVVPDEIVGGACRYPTDPDWAQRLRARLGGCDARPVAGVDAPMIDPHDKQRLGAATGAAIADMESHVAAQMARQAGLPCAVLRVVADAADRGLPPAAVIGMRPGGGINLMGVLGSLLRHPRQLPDLARVAGDVRIAVQQLTRCRQLLGPALGWTAPVGGDRR